MTKDSDPLKAAPMKAREGGLPSAGDPLRELIEQAPDGVFIADLDGRYTDVNSAGCRIFGCAREAILGRTIVDFIPQEEVDRLWQNRDQLLQGGANVAEWTVQRGDGTLVPIEVSDTILSDGRWVGFVRDISKRKELEARLLEHEQQLRTERNFVDTILDTAAALVLVTDAEGCIVRFNKACEAATGVSAAEVLGTCRWEDCVPPEERETVRRIVARLRSGEASVEHESHWQHRDGAKRLINWRNTVLRDRAGQIRYLIGIGIDITDQRSAEQGALQHLEEASRLQRLQTANELATMLAHELNQPLATIATYAAAGEQLLRRPESDPGRLTEILQRISEQALRAGDAIRHLRAFVGRGRIKPVPVDLNAVVRRACAMLAPQARSGAVSVTLDLAATPPTVLGIDVHIEQVLLNLLGNAIDAIRDAGMTSGNVTVTTRPDGKVAQVDVRDSGPGVDAATAARLFEPFFSRKETGLGVGLPISRSLVEAQGGRLWVEPHTPGGILHFTLPLAS